MSLSSDRARAINRIFFDPVQPALVAGSVTGVIGLVSGGFTGVFQSSTPVLFSGIAGLQCFSLGASFWYSRGALIKAFAKEEPTPSQKLKYSAAAGSFTGAFNGALRSRSNVIPATIVFTSIGFLGQAAINVSTRVDNASVEASNKTFSQRIMESKWMPLKPIPDEDYIQILEERVLSIDAQIAVIDDKIKSLSSKGP